MMRLALVLTLSAMVPAAAQLALPSAKQLDFQTNHPKGCFFHFGINTFTAQEHGTGDATTQPPSKFDAPADLDTDQWVRTCVAYGGTYGVFTAKHEEGMMNWPSTSTNYSIASSPFCAARKKLGRSCDLVAEFLASCDKYNVTRGLYYTIANSHCKFAPGGGAPGQNVTCDQMLRNAFTELATKYGPIAQFWFDHGNELFVDLVDKYQPAASTMGREWTLVGTEGGYVLEGANSLWSPSYPMGTSNASANSWLAYQCDTSLSNSGWFWHGNAAPKFSASTGVDLYGEQCIGVGAGLILNFPPSTKGIVEPSFVSWAGQFHAEWQKRFADPVATNVSSTALTTDRGPANQAMVAVMIPGRGTTIDRVVIREDLRFGQRIAGWRLEALKGQPDGKKIWSEVGVGSTIGTMRIFDLGASRGQFVPGQTPSKSCGHAAAALSDVFALRFRPTISTSSDGVVHVAELSAFNSDRSSLKVMPLLLPLKLDDAEASPIREPLDKPNIVLLFVDDLGYGDLGFTGHPSTSTPALDRLASDGKRLTSWYSGYPVCTSSRTALMTGRQPPRVGMPGVINSLSAAGLPLTEVTLADGLKAQGYATLALGKWHLGQQPQYLPAARGFDAFLGLPFSVDDGEGIGDDSKCAKPGERSRKRGRAAGRSSTGGRSGTLGDALGPSLPLPLILQNRSANISKIVEQPTDLRFLTARMLNFSKAFIADHRSQPFFVYFAFGHVHTATPNVNPHTNPYNGKQYAGCDFLNTSRRGLFGDALQEVDGAVDQLLNPKTGWIKSQGLDRNTLTVFTSDNGPSIRWGLAAGSVGIFSGQIDAHTSSAEVVSTMDLLPSLLEIAGAKPISGRAIDGKTSLAAIMLDNRGGARSAHSFLPFYNEPAIANASSRIFAARYGALKAHWITSPGLGGGMYGGQLRPNRYGPTVNGFETVHEPPLIYNVEHDPSESLPLDPGASVLAELKRLKKAYENQLAPAKITPEFGFEWALCCGVGCKAPCAKCQCTDVPLPQ